jgi:hypothetical protein
LTISDDVGDVDQLRKHLVIVMGQLGLLKAAAIDLKDRLKSAKRAPRLRRGKLQG